jgi:hypothetical protein
MAITFDPSTRRIILDSASVTATEIYSRWVDWAATGDNLKYGMAIRQVGSDDLGDGLSIPPYYFLQGSWRVRPMESDHTLTITGNLFVEGGGVPVVRTLGSYQVNVNYTVPVQAQGISTTGGSGDASWTALLEGDMTYQDAMRLLVAVAVGKTEIASNLVKFKSLDGLTDRITATMTGSQRTTVVLNPD